jgi:hypothetical protein
MARDHQAIATRSPLAERSRNSPPSRCDREHCNQRHGEGSGTRSVQADYFHAVGTCQRCDLSRWHPDVLSVYPATPLTKAARDGVTDSSRRRESPPQPVEKRSEKRSAAMPAGANLLGNPVQYIFFPHSGAKRIGEGGRGVLRRPRLTRSQWNGVLLSGPAHTDCARAEGVNRAAARTGIGVVFTRVTL